MLVFYVDFDGCQGIVDTGPINAQAVMDLKAGAMQGALQMLAVQAEKLVG